MMGPQLCAAISDPRVYVIYPTAFTPLLSADSRGLTYTIELEQRYYQALRRPTVIDSSARGILTAPCLSSLCPPKSPEELETEHDCLVAA